MKDTVIFDLDGTLALTEHRQHILDDTSNPHRWRDFFAACVHDQPNEPVIAALHAHMAAGHSVMIVSGRSDEVRPQTEAWLFEHVFKGRAVAFAPIMRREGDYTPDDMLKRQWLGDGTIPHERVLCAYDDRDKVVQMWRNAGIACFQVAPGEF